MPCSGTFGRECAEPDFQAAAWFRYTQAEKTWKRLVRGRPGLLAAAAALLALIAGGAGILAWRNASAGRRTRAG